MNGVNGGFPARVSSEGFQRSPGAAGRMTRSTPIDLLTPTCPLRDYPLARSTLRHCPGLGWGLGEKIAVPTLGQARPNPLELRNLFTLRVVTVTNKIELLEILYMILPRTPSAPFHRV
jgi:hypothetical protein